MDGFEEKYLEVLELIEDLAGYSGDNEELLKRREGISLKLAQLSSGVETAAVEAAAAAPGNPDALEPIKLARQHIEIGYRRLRNAQVVASHARAERWARQRDDLLRPAKPRAGDETDGGAAPERSEHRAVADFDPSVAKSEDITAVLRRVHQMAQGEVLKGELNIEELDSSTKTLKELEDKYSAVDVLLNGSRRLVQVLEAADRGDRRRMQMALGFLAAVLCWIIYRRLLKLPLKILFWNIISLVKVGKWATGLVPRGTPAADETYAAATLVEQIRDPDIETDTVYTEYRAEAVRTELSEEPVLELEPEPEPEFDYAEAADPEFDYVEAADPELPDSPEADQPERFDHVEPAGENAGFDAEPVEYAELEYAELENDRTEYAEPEYAEPENAEPESAEPEGAESEPAEPESEYAEPVEYAEDGFEYAEPVEYAEPQHEYAEPEDEYAEPEDEPAEPEDEPAEPEPEHAEPVEYAEDESESAGPVEHAEDESEYAEPSKLIEAMNAEPTVPDPVDSEPADPEPEPEPEMAAETAWFVDDADPEPEAEPEPVTYHAPPVEHEHTPMPDTGTVYYASKEL